MVTIYIITVSLIADEIGYRYYHDMDNEREAVNLECTMVKSFLKVR